MLPEFLPHTDNGHKTQPGTSRLVFAGVVRFGVLVNLSLLVIFLLQKPKGTSPKQGFDNSYKTACKCLKPPSFPLPGSELPPSEQCTEVRDGH